MSETPIIIKPAPYSERGKTDDKFNIGNPLIKATAVIEPTIARQIKNKTDLYMFRGVQIINKLTMPVKVKITIAYVL